MAEPNHIQFSVRVPPLLKAEITRALEKGRFRSLNEFMLTCIRAYLDETGTTAGSRATNHQQLSEQLDQLHASLLWNLLQTQMLIANNSYTILDELAPEDAEAEPPTPDLQLANAQQYSQRALSRWLTAQERILEQLSEHLRKKRAASNVQPPPKTTE
jgi:Arc/MetJ-type ribon-helix-helix transcriptional regulator